MIHKIEVERKFILDENNFDDLLDLSPIERFDIGRRKTFYRPYIYYDTPDLKLLDKGITLSARLRENDCVLSYKLPKNSPEERDEYQLSLLQNRLISLGSPLFITNKISRFLTNLYEAIGPVSLLGTLSMSVENTRMPIFNNGLYVLDLSVAKFKGENIFGRSNILYEAEVELQEEGSIDDMLTFSQKIQKDYSLQQITSNKYQRMMDSLDKSGR
ncbi:MAG: CYTH domain-containing protein [Nanoarchaeota archaeon]|nr:CYTH domain-containing protein [Nanoarchaeota archaeon]MBU1631577.1 CYTH domain-containing protein [Nanoarchaeota archaeon]MBU1875493.1 CYTH domain-containing protein [Nanoarchaeota archaeon]